MKPPTVPILTSWPYYLNKSGNMKRIEADMPIIYDTMYGHPESDSLLML